MRLGLAGEIADGPHGAGRGADRLDDLGEPVGFGQDREQALVGGVPGGQPLGPPGFLLERVDGRAGAGDVAGGEEGVAAGQVERGRDLGVGFVDAVERVEGHAVEVAGLLVGDPLHGSIGGPAAGVDRLGRAARGRALVPVVGEVGEAGVLVAVAAGRLQQLGDGAVQPDPLQRHELGQEDLADQRVGEPEAAGRAGLLDDQAGPVGFGDLVGELGAAHLLDEAEVEARPGDRRHRQRIVGPVREPRQAPPGRLPHTLGERARLPGSTGLVDVAQHLDQEERVPGGDLGELLPERPVVVAHRGEVVGDVGGPKATEAQPLAGAVPAEVGEGAGERVAAPQLRVPVRPDDEQPRGLGAAQDVPEQRQRRLAGPVQVVEDEQDRRLLRPGAQQPGDGVEQGQPLALGIGPPGAVLDRQQLGDLGHHPGQLLGAAHRPQPGRAERGSEGAQRLDERVERRGQVLVAAAVEDDAARAVGGGGQLGGQAGLAHARFASDEHGPPVPGDRVLPQPVELGRPRRPGRRTARR